MNSGVFEAYALADAFRSLARQSVKQFAVRHLVVRGGDHRIAKREQRIPPPRIALPTLGVLAV